MRDENPYAPPVDSPDAPAPTPRRGELSISAGGWLIVRSLARWMRVVSTVMILGAALCGLFGLLLLPRGNFAVAPFLTIPGTAAGAILVLIGGFFALAAIWLRQSARCFQEGVLADAERPLALGFRKLRLYLALYGVYSVLLLGSKLIQLWRR